ncbi:hypothetical protein BDZ97DRAFT_1925478 [Flammula alnicola]|nr:hypothetical protein BDZ97DRAFT_1925478 [Flammula alnicola]
MVRSSSLNVSQPCPNIPSIPGVLTPGKGGRLILANTEQLHERIDQMSARNRELEDALRKLQEAVSDQPHPLLETGVLRINIQQGSSSGPSTSSSSKSPSTSRVSPTTHPPDPAEVKLEEDHNVIDTFGTLVVGRRGESRFLGKTARPEYLAQATSKPLRPSKQALPRLSKRMMEASFPDPEIRDDGLLSEVLDLLPPHSEALHLCDLYLEYGKFLYSPMSRKELLDETLAVVYRAKQYGAFEHHHSLSLLFAVFAMATLFNPNKQPYSTEAHEYYHLSRTSLHFSPPVHETTLTAIQTVIHMSQYLDLSDSDLGGLESAWMHIGHAMRLGQSVGAFLVAFVGLHLNSTRWKLHEEASQRRSELFWRLFVSDTWTSLHLGRPPGISRAHIDVALPRHLDHISGSDADPANTFHSWNVQFTLLLHSMMETALGPKQPVYSALLEYDRKIRDFHVPVQWRIPPEEELSAPPPDVAMYRWLVLSSKEIAILNLHRGYFAQALQETPSDLQRHRYLPSVVAIYRSAWRLIRGLAMTWMVIPKFLSRVNLAWSHGLSAAIVLCLFVTRAPTSQVTSAALEELDNLTSLFDSSSPSCRSAAKLLTSVQNLRRKAHEAIGLPHTRFHHYNEGTSTVTVGELDRLNGRTHLFAFDEHGSSSSTSGTASSSASTTHETRSRATSVTISDIAEGHPPMFHNTDNLHPTLAQDLREFGLRSVSSYSAPSMSFFDYPSDTSSSSSLMTMPAPMSMSPPLPQPVRETPPEPARLLLPPYQPPTRTEPPPPPMQYFHQALQQEPLPFFEPRRSTFSHSIGSNSSSSASMIFPSGFQSGFPSGWGTGFGPSPIILDSSWNSFVEQLGF